MKRQRKMKKIKATRIQKKNFSIDLHIKLERADTC